MPSDVGDTCSPRGSGLVVARRCSRFTTSPVEGPARLVDGKSMQTDVDRRGQLGVVKTEQLLDEALPDEWNSQIADGVPDGHAFDAHRIEIGATQRLQPRRIWRQLVLLVVIPCVGNRFRGSGAGDAGERDQAGEAACLECSAREADEEDLVSRLVILTQEAIAALDAAADAEADGTDREGPLAQSRFGGDADLVVHDL